MWRGAAASIEAQEPRIGPRCLPLFSEIVVVVVVVTTTAATNPCRIFHERVGREGGGSAASGQRRRRQQGRMGDALGGVSGSCDVWSLVPGVWCALIHSMTSCFDLK